MTIDAKTIAIYDEKTTEYAAMTDGVPHDLVRFEQMLPRCANVLDYGCGPGTASIYFSNAGHSTDAFDASANMVAHAQKHADIRAWQATFDQFDADTAYDGIWASFSLLHAAREDIPKLLRNIHTGLTANGHFYIAMKLGTGRHRDDLERLYTYVNQDELYAWLSAADFEWIDHTTGKAPGLDGSISQWIGVFARAQS